MVSVRIIANLLVVDLETRSQNLEAYLGAHGMVMKWWKLERDETYKNKE